MGVAESAVWLEPQCSGPVQSGPAAAALTCWAGTGRRLVLLCSGMCLLSDCLGAGACAALIAPDVRSALLQRGAVGKLQVAGAAHLLAAPSAVSHAEVRLARAPGPATLFLCRCPASLRLRLLRRHPLPVPPSTSPPAGSRQRRGFTASPQEDCHLQLGHAGRHQLLLPSARRLPLLKSSALPAAVV